MTQIPDQSELNQPPMANRDHHKQPASAQGQGGDTEAKDLCSFQVNPSNINEEDFDFNGTSRKEYENEFWKRVCSEIIDDFMWLGSDLIARDKETLGKIGITHVINCAADYSEDYMKSDGVTYKSYHLKDHVAEDISCVFYDAIEFIQNVKRQKGKVYVHCVQGISRSATIIIAYKIFTEKCTYEEAYEYMKSRRGCVNPNLKFILQLR